MSDSLVVQVDMTGVAIPVRMGIGLGDVEEIGTVELGQPDGGDFGAGLADLLEAVAVEIRKGL